MTITELPRRIRDAMPTRMQSARRPDEAASLPPARGAGFARGFVAMRHPNYRRYWFGQIGSLVGAWMQSVALPWLVLQLGGSPRPLARPGGVAALEMTFQTPLPLFSRNALGFDSGGYGALFATMGAGSLLGSLALAFATSQRPMLRLFIGGGAVFLALAFALGLVRQPVLVFALVAGIGFASMLMVNTINVTIQNSVPDALRGRVMSLYVTVFAGSAPIGGVIAGSMAQAWGAPAAFSIGAALAGVVLAFVAWRLRTVRMP